MAPRRTRAEGGHVTVRGLDEFRRELRRLGQDLPNDLADANQRVAQHVVNKATSKAAGLGPMWARAASSLKAARQQRIAAIHFGGARHPEAMGAEFGSAQNMLRQTSRGAVRGWNQFRPWRGSGGNAGYFLYRTIRAETDQVIDLYGEAIEDISRKTFPD